MRKSKFICKTSPVRSGVVIKTAQIICTSTLTFVQGEYEVRGFSVLPNSCVQCTKSLLKNAVPLSCTICWGIPNRVMYFSINLTVSGASAVLDGHTCIKLEKLSTISRPKFESTNRANK